MKTINLTILVNTECPIVKAYTPVINEKVGVLLDHGVSLHFVWSPAL